MSFRAFCDELVKLSASKSSFTVPQSRSGRRSMHVETMLRKDREGTLLRHKLSEAVGVRVVDGAKEVLTGNAARQQLSQIQQALPLPIFPGLSNLFQPDQIQGGLADGRSPDEFDPASLSKGMKVEMEHTGDPVVAREIAMDHLTEDADYYNKLEKMESKKTADAAINRWYELPFTDGERLLQNVPVRSARKPGDAPAAADDGPHVQSGVDGRVVGVSAPAPKLGGAPSPGSVKRAIDEYLGDSADSTLLPKNRLLNDTDHLVLVRSSPDPQPITEAEDAYLRV